MMAQTPLRLIQTVYPVAIVAAVAAEVLVLNFPDTLQTIHVQAVVVDGV